MNQTQISNFMKCFLQIDEPIVNLATCHDHDRDEHHEHEHGHHNKTGSLLTAKVTAMVVLFCASAMCGTIPFLLNRLFQWTENQMNARSTTIVKCLLYFGGGVLLATTFLHLLPEVREGVLHLQECGIIAQLPFPLSELLMCAGFFLMYFIEEAIHSYVHRHQTQDDEAAAAFERGHNIRKSHLLKMTTPPIPENMSNTTLTPPSAMPFSGSQESAAVSLSVQSILNADDLKHQKYNEATSSCPLHKCHLVHQQHCNDGHNHIQMSDARNNTKSDMLASSLRGFFIVSALSLHELFEGMAIGLEISATSVWFMFGAVSAHKLVLSFCVGVELIVARIRMTLAILYVLIFAVVSPIGIGVGILINHSQSGVAAPNSVSVVFQGLACGTLIYVVFFEILSKSRSGLRAYVALFVGFVIMFGLQLLGGRGGHGHSHNHSCSLEEQSQDYAIATQSKPIGYKPHQQPQYHDDHHHTEEDATRIVNNQQLQILRQITQKLLESRPKMD